MKTWNDYKKYVRNIDAANNEEIENIEKMAEIITTIIEQRTKLGISQRDLALLSNMPQSSIARVESFKTTPSVDTLLRIIRPLGLTLSIIPLPDSEI